jgi:hypothetical protein
MELERRLSCSHEMQGDQRAAQSSSLRKNPTFGEIRNPHYAEMKTRISW